MYQIGGVYAGKHIWASSFYEGGFDDQEISIESVQNYGQDFVTSDRESIQGNSQKEMALAYYAYKHIKSNRKNQEKVFEILCDDEKVDLFVFDRFDQRYVNKVLHQTEYLAADETEKILAAKYIIQLLVDEYPDSEDLENAQEELEEYEYDLINGTTSKDFSSIKALIESIYNQIAFTDNTAHIKLLGYQCEVKKEWYSEQVSEDLIDSYLSLIRRLLNRINNNFEMDDWVFVYSKNILDTPNAKYRLDQIAKENCIEIIVEKYSEKFVSRGNAYYCYLVNYIQFNRIKKNVGHYSALFEGVQKDLQFETDRLLFTSKNDFNENYSFRIINHITDSFCDIEMLVPFSLSGTVLELEYAYDAVGLIVKIKDCSSEEVHTETIHYK